MFNTADTLLKKRSVVKGKCAGERGRVSRVDFACVQWRPPGKGYLKTGTDGRVSRPALTKKRGARSGAGHFQCPPRKKHTPAHTPQTHKFEPECAESAALVRFRGSGPDMFLAPHNCTQRTQGYEARREQMWDFHTS